MSERKSNGSDAARGTAALQKGFAVLDALGERGGSASFTDLVRTTGLPKGTLHRLLAALVTAGMMRFERRDDLYRFGWKLIEFARFAEADLDLAALVEPELVRLHAQTGETVLLALPHGPDVVCARVTAGGAHLRQDAILPGHCTAAGKAILAFASPSARSASLARLPPIPFTRHTVTSATTLDAQLDVAKARRYAVEDREWLEAGSAVAAPILDATGRAVGALAVAGPSHRLDAARLHEIGADLIRAAARVTGQTAFTQPSHRRSATMETDVRCAVASRAFLGEGPVWDSRNRELHWLDILAPALHRSDPVSGSDRISDLPEIVGAFAPRASGGFVVGAQSGFALLDAAGGAWTRLSDPEADRPGNRFNDGKCDTRGRFWAGTMDMAVAPGAGSLYRLDPDGTVHRMETGIGISNGLGWSPDDRRMYFTDSLARTIFVYDFDAETGAISRRRVFAQAPDHMGVPDGLAVDAEGHVWSAQWDGWQVIRYDPDGRIDRTISVPVPRPTSCTFGGDGMTTLFITSARIRLSASQLAEAPQSGSVFAVEAATRGLPDNSFAG